jgi:hypothetical protein
MAIRNDFAPGEVLAAADLNDTFGSKADYPSGGSDGQALLKSGTTTAWGAAGGKVLQVVRATDNTARTTTSTTLVDANLSVTITPGFTNSVVLLIATVRAAITGTATTSFGQITITDNSNNAISGATAIAFGDSAATTSLNAVTAIAYATPATDLAITYKLRFSCAGGSSRSLTLQNNESLAQLFAIEVSA